MQVGVNYPWFDYGWDFGEAPPGWRSGSNPNWAAQVDADLQRFIGIGIRVVRWFILGDGLTYGIGSEAPRLDRSGPTPEWRFDPPALSDAFQAHFEALLDRFGAANQGSSAARIALLPVFVDFNLCAPGLWPIGRPDPAQQQSVADPGWVKGGRADVINQSQQRKAFLQNALQPLLTISQSAPPGTIYAWEVINEPEWVTTGWHPDTRTPHPVAKSAMLSFLQEAIAMIRRARFKPTVGFAKIETIARTRLFADINQFHHYTDGTRALGRHTFNPQYPGIIGEFATSSANDTWPELVRTDQRVLNRLRTAERLGYPLALPWSFRGHDRHTSWTLREEQDIECFTVGRHCPTP